MKNKNLLFRCHGEDAETRAQIACEFIKGYFDNWNQRVNVFIEPMERISLEDTTPLPWDVFIETANQDRVNIAHAAGWSFLVAREWHERELAELERAAIPPPKDE